MTNRHRKKAILFLSGSDFKEKSIQVIRKTPEAYVKDGWKVVYVVGRDRSKSGDYFYEGVLNPAGVEVIRFYVPFAKLHDLFDNVLWKAIWFRIRNLLLVISLGLRGITQLRSHKFDVLYGYEIPGVLAARLVRALGWGRNCMFVTRFQGVLFVKEWLRRQQKFRYLSNIEAFIALKTASDLCIMTNDGSQGVDVLRKISSGTKKILFYTNGVDHFVINNDKLRSIKEKYYRGADIYLVSVSRLDGHKRLDRGIKVVHHLVKNFGFKDLKYVIVGEGAERDKLQSLISKMQLEENVYLIGAVNHDDVKYHLECADIFISMYTSTNVGNPLLEAIRSNKIIVTLNNGDTGEWIKHNCNGLIYDVNDIDDLAETNYMEIASDIAHMVVDESEWTKLKSNLKETERNKLWTWEERFAAELKEVSSLLN